ncbi:hypothetical protein E2C01_024063 [Portunus trituberculatus]|uniref:Uncharacterized protein n=1 Tax=Portunus trituberculatus TaxID=210409 RepID=A0A5B7EDE4_PORTR|nr:hypothetical protein [Portunus trituberculatus]
MESLVSRAYPTVQEDMRLHIYVKRGHPKDVQEALTGASEMEVFLKTTTDAPRLVLPRYEERTDALPHHVKARRTTTGKTSRWWKESPWRVPRILLGM